MKYTSLRYTAPLMMGVMLLASPDLAQAGWGHLYGGSSGAYAAGYGSSGYGSSGYGSSGYAASYGSSGYSSYGSSGYTSLGSSGHIGLGARLHAHIAAKRARHAARRAARYSSYGSSGYGSSGHSYGSSGYSSYGSSGGSSGSYSSSYGSSGYSASVSYGSSGSSYGSSGTAYGSVGSTYYGASTRSAASMSSFAADVDGDEVYLTVAVPADAKVFVNGKATTSSGTLRQFVSRGLEVGKSYKFEVRAELTAADGEPMVETKTLVASAGDSENVQFAFSDYNKPIQTELVLNVPEGAQVELGGNQTNAVGSKRTYRTTQLSPGDVWDEYQVTVRLGDEVKSRTIRLIGGDQLQLTFAFDESADKLASR